MHGWPYALCLTLCAVLAASASAQRQIYRSVDEKGNVTFSDQPPADARSSERIDMPATNRAPAVEIQQRESSGAAQEEEAAAPTISITAPANEATVAMGPGNFSVSGAADPPLQRGEGVQLFMDGEPVGGIINSPSWFLQGVARGPHDLQIKRMSRQGEAVAASETVRVYVLRPSLITRGGR